MSIDEEKRAAGAPSHAGPATDTSSAAAAGSATAAGGPAPKKRPKRGWIVAGVVAAVIVVAGAGFWVWHEQPSFCNAICHSPMDYYVETYDSGDPNLGVTAHAKAGESCLDCHTAELTTQISEVCAWVSDNYPMTEDGTMLATGKQFASEEFCARPECHGGKSFDEITAGRGDSPATTRSTTRIPAIRTWPWNAATATRPTRTRCSSATSAMI